MTIIFVISEIFSKKYITPFSDYRIMEVSWEDVPELDNYNLTCANVPFFML